MEDFAKHIKTSSKNLALDGMGKHDMIIEESIYKSIREGRKTLGLDLGTMGIVS